jgi:hypothetical protein
VNFPIVPLLTFRSSPELSHYGAAGQLSLLGCLPCALPPFGVFPMMASHVPQGFQALVKVPPQRFSRSRGFTPPIICRPCFMPVPPLGFPSRADFHPQSCTFFRTPIPSCGWSEDLHFKVFVPASVLALHQLSLAQSSDPPGFFLLRGFSLFADAPGSYPLTSFLDQRVETSWPWLLRVLSTKRLA